MSPQIIVSAHAPIEITKPCKIGLGYTVLEAGVCFGILNGMKGQISQRKTAMRSVEVASIYFVRGCRHVST